MGIQIDSVFIKLSKRKIQSCIACMGCTKDNICKVKDDFQQIAEKVKHVGAVVVGGYPPRHMAAGRKPRQGNS